MSQNSIAKTTLKSGLRVLAIPQQGTMAATVLVLVRTGSKYETKRVSGISHFLEHMFFKGTKKRPTPLEISEPIERVGGIMNAFTGEDYTGYYVKIDASKVELALDIVADIYSNSTFPSKEIEKEKGVVIEEINMYRDHPTRHIYDMFQEVLYGDQPAGWNIAGTRESVLSLYRKDLVEYMTSQYVAPETIVCVAGNIAEKKVLASIERSFQNLRASGFREKQPVGEAQSRPEALLEQRNSEQVQIALGVRGVNLSDPRRYAQDLAATYLGGMMSSRLFIEVREKLGLVYSISTSSENNPDTGFLVTMAGVKHDQVDKAIGTILREYKKLTKTLLSAAEMKKIKEHEIGRMILRLEASDEKASFYGMEELLEGTLFTPEQVYGKIRKVRASDIRNLAQSIFRTDRLNLAVLGNFEGKARFQRLLKL